MEEERKLGAPEEKAASPAADGAQGIPLPAGTDRPEHRSVRRAGSNACCK